MNKKNLFIFGGKSTALEIYETAVLLNLYSNIFLVVSDSETKIKKNTIKESDLQTIINGNQESYFIVSMSNLKTKEKCLKLGHFLGLNLASIIHPTSLISNTSQIGKGVYLAANSIISNNVIIGNNCMINYQVVIGHDSKIKENCVINPGVVIGGNSFIEKNVLIGANSVIKQNLKISADSKIDALTYVYFDVEKNSVCTSRNTKLVNL